MTIYIGARQIVEAGALPDRSGPMLILDPDPDRARDLTTMAAGQAAIEIVAAAPSTRAEAEPWRQFTFSAMNGFVAAERFHAVFPGLRELRNMTVPRLSGAELARRLPADGKNCMLVLDMLGEEAAALDTLEEAGVMDRLTRIVLRSARDQLDPQGPNTASLGARLSAAGFSPGREIEGSDPDFPLQVFTRSPLHAQLVALRERLAGREARIAQLEEELQARDARVQALETAKQQETAEADKAREKQEELRRDASVALRMQALREADLKDLQAQYAELVERKAAQDDLLEKLTLRLDSAAQYLGRIQRLPEAGPDRPATLPEGTVGLIGEVPETSAAPPAVKASGGRDSRAKGKAKGRRQADG